MLESLRNEGIPLISISGPGEFLADRPYPPQFDQDQRKALENQTLAQALALNAMPQDLICLSPQVAAIFQQLRLPLPEKALEIFPEPRIHYIERGGKRLAFILLPQGADPEGRATRAQLEAATLAAREARYNADLVILISPWGMREEMRLAPEFAGLADVILGGGTGLGLFPEPFPAAPELLWFRSELKGRSVRILEILSWPEAGRARIWLENINYAWREIMLDASVQDDPEVMALTAAVPDS